ncbi:hypothetical protein [Actinoplanes sp. L3-i22]|uniref:hypothetical protein n=1 Tax=Actinoplanes sp. L3-i22 TaxID=2836373 RepID=UPI001C75009B|nr:hypothetical protein [Actinoplanes sp. L3-i22]BCY13195.1 hypothetical protein L3i22_082830 [Actinoplanes sp. L3-i22]
MGEFADQLSVLSVRADSPDGRITGSVESPPRASVRFRDGAYRGYSDGELGHQLGQLAALLFARYRREYDEILAAYRDLPAGSDAVQYTTPQEITFRERQAALTVHGRSTRGRLEVDTRALVRWEVRVAAGTVSTLSEAEFLTEAESVIVDVLRDWRSQTILLTHEIYGIGVPKWLTDARLGQR